MEKEETKKEKKSGWFSRNKYTIGGVAVGMVVGGLVVKYHKQIISFGKNMGNAATGLLKKKKPVATTVTGIGDTIPEVKPEVTSAPTNGGNGYKNGGYRSLNSHQRVNNVNL
jgi:hypothetical protein